MKELFWFYGFKVFWLLKHPVHAPMKALKRLLRQGHEEHHPPDDDSRPFAVPKRIWMYWAQGWADAPPLVKLCHDSWLRRNPDWEVVSLSRDDTSKYLTLSPHLESSQIPHAAYSDILRVSLLSRYGGVWADATTFCADPLNNWLPDLTQSGVFLFSKPRTTIASWFVAAESEHPLIRTWESYIARYWLRAKSVERYFWMHYLFEYMIWLRPELRKVWLNTPQVDSGGPYSAHKCLKRTDIDVSSCAELVNRRAHPVYKFRWKRPPPDWFLEELRSHLPTEA